MLLTLIEKWIKRIQSHRLSMKIFLTNLWITFKANFGGKPGNIVKNNAYQIVIFTCLLAGSIFWIGYRSSLTAGLSIVNFDLPFDDLESLLVSNYRWLIYIGNWRIYNTNFVILLYEGLFLLQKAGLCLEPFGGQMKNQYGASSTKIEWLNQNPFIPLKKVWRKF